MRIPSVTSIHLPVVMIAGQTHTGFISGMFTYSALQPICTSKVMSCYAAGGATWGATLGLTAPPTIAACNAAFGGCQYGAHKVAYFAGMLPLP